MSGTHTGFNAAEVRDGLHLAMQMGAPTDEADRARFYFKSTYTHTAAADNEDVPFDPLAPVTKHTQPPVSIPCALELHDAAGKEVVFGEAAPVKIVATVLDEDYTQIKGCAYMVFGGMKYDFRRRVNTTGLFDLGVHSLVFVADGEA